MLRYRVLIKTNNVLTKVYKMNKDKPVEVPIETLSDLEDLLTLGRIINMVLRINKVWVTDSKYGVNIECEQMLLKQKEKEKTVCAF